MLEQWCAGDVLVMTGLDRHARSIRDLRDNVERIGQADGPCAVSPSHGPI